MLQVQRATSIIPGIQFKGPKELFLYMYKNWGLYSCCRGFGATLLRDVPGSMFYFVTYDWVKGKFSKKDGSLSVPGTMLAGGMGGVFYWASIMPFDTLKTLVQVTPPADGRGMIQIFRELVNSQGVRGVVSLYRGISPVLLRAFPSNAACFLGYEVVKLGLCKIGL